MQQVQRLREWHTQLLEFLVLNPRATYDEMAAKFDCHAMTVCTIVNSDLFQAQLASRQAQRAAATENSVLRKLTSLAEQSIDALSDRLAKEKHALGLADIRETAEMALQGLGYGSGKAGSPATAPGQPGVNLQVVVVNRSDLEEARALMRQHGGRVGTESLRALSAAV